MISSLQKTLLKPSFASSDQDKDLYSLFGCNSFASLQLLPFIFLLHAHAVYCGSAGRLVRHSHKILVSFVERRRIRISDLIKQSLGVCF